MTRQISAGGVLIGGGAPVTVQSMCDTPTQDISATLSQIRGLHAAGCELVRVAVPDMDAAEALKEIVKGSPIPVVADIHFDHTLAVRAVENGVAKIRINPGNIGAKERVREVVRACGERKVPIRIGVNGGSVRRGLLEQYGLREAMLRSGLEQVHMLEEMGFSDICLSFKASNVPDTVAVNRMAAGRPGADDEVEICERLKRTWGPASRWPLHLGVTETGTRYHGLIKSAAGIGALLLDGIGGTIRVSLTAPPVEEVRAGIALLKAAGLRKGGVEIISCPTCGRCGIDVAALAQAVEQRLSDIQAPLKVAVMGCAVNGPGEAREADIGVAGHQNGQAVLFRKGEVVGNVAEREIVDILVREARILQKELHK